jgi:prepilin-type N-terminal cleavage/methylation domain-containing protein
MMLAVRDEGGFTLPELLVGMVILTIVAAGFTQMLISTSKTSNRVEEQAMLQNDVRASLDRLTSDLREATNAHGTSPVEAATPTTLTFDSPDRATPYHLRRISYRLTGGTFQRSTLVSTSTGTWPWTFPAAPAPWTTELDSITNTDAFTYYDANGALTTVPSAIRSVRVSFTVAPHQAQGGSSSYNALITIRTLQ